MSENPQTALPPDEIDTEANEDDEAQEPSPPLFHLIYCSSSSDKSLSAEGLEAILEQSRENNEQADITGILLYENGSFFQVLEGEGESLEQLYKTIEEDPRHERVTKLIFEEIEQRAFGAWSMGYPKVTREDLRSVPGLNDFFTQGHSFMELGAGRAKSLLNAFKKGKWRV